MKKNDRAHNEEKLIARWERKLERLGLGVLEPLCPSEQFTRLRPRTVDKYKWYEMQDDTESSVYREYIQSALKKLPYRERQIVMLHDGIGDDMQHYTFKELGHIFQITQVRIQQLYEKAVRKLFDHIVHDAANNKMLF